MKFWQFVLLWLLVIVGIAIFTGCCTHPANARPRHYSLDSGSGPRP